MCRLVLVLVATAVVWACTVPADLDPNVNGVGGMNGGHAGSSAGFGGKAGTSPPDAAAPDMDAPLATEAGVLPMGGAAGGGMAGGTGGANTGGMAGVGGTGNVPVNPPDSADFNFEQNTQGWEDLPNPAGVMGKAPDQARERQYNGAASLKYTIDVPGGEHVRIVGLPTKSGIGPLPTGTLVTFQVWVPLGHKLKQLEAFVQNIATGQRIGETRAGAQLGTEAWSQFTITIPNASVGKDQAQLGVRFVVTGPWTGSIYIDSVDVQLPP